MSRSRADRSIRISRLADLRSSPLLDAVLGLGLLLLLKTTAAVTLPIAAAALLVLLLSGVAEALETRGIPAVAAAALVVFVPAGLLAGLMVACLPAALGWWRDIRAAFARLVETLPDGPLTAWAQGWMSDASLARAAAGLEADAAPLAFGVASVLMLGFFLLWAQRPLVAGVLAAAPDRRSRIRWLGALRDARRGAGSYLATMGWINLGLAVLTGVGLAVLGVAHVAAWIAVIVVLLFIPYLGPAAIALLLATAGRGGSALSIAAPPLLFLALHAIEAQFVSPWLMGRRLGVARPALLLAVLAGGWAWGVAGGVLAVPLLIAAQALLRRRPGGALWKAALAHETGGAASLAATASRVLENRPGALPPSGPAWSAGPPLGGGPACRMPRPSRSEPACASPTSPKPTLPS